MKTMTLMQSLTAITASLFLTATMATAHSGHDNSKLPMQWKFSKNVEAKIQARGSLAGTGYYIGLSRHEQDVLKHYGIKDGNLFTAAVDGVNALVKRTMAGIQIVDTGVTDIGEKIEMPIRPLNRVSLISTGESMSHAGHDHRMVAYEWSFGESTQHKVAQRLGQGDEVFVGLTRFEQTLLNNYDIKVGNRFHTVIDDQTVIAERTSGGLKVMGPAHNQVAQASQESM